MTITTETLAALEAAARAAVNYIAETPDAKTLAQLEWWAQSNPATILALIEALRAAERRAETAESQMREVHLSPPSIDMDSYNAMKADRDQWKAKAEEAEAILRSAYTMLAFAFNRLHSSARSRDGELCDDVGKTRGQIEHYFKNHGVKL